MSKVPHSTGFDRAPIGQRLAPLGLLIFIALLFSVASITLDWLTPKENSFELPDTDDAMRIVQVLDLKDGQDWYDLTQKRLNPPEGVRMHWSRLPDLPLLGVLSLAEPVMGRNAAIHLTATVVPPLLGILFFATFVWAAAPLVERALLPTVGMVCLALILPQMLFAPERVDHHGWQLILAMIGAGALIRTARDAGSVGALIVAGLAGALGLWVGAEAIPTIAFITLGLTLLWWARGDDAARVLLPYGASLTLGVLLLYPIALVPADWGRTECDAFSLVSLGLAGGVLSFGTGLLFLERRWSSGELQARLLAAIVLAIGLLLILLLLFPDCRYGPYGRFAPEIVEFLNSIVESQSMWVFIEKALDQALLILSLPIVALVLILWRIVVVDESERWVWGALLLLLVASLLMTFWQMRTAPLANACAGLALAWWAAQWARRAKDTERHWLRALFRVGPILAILGVPLLSSSLVSNFAVPSKSLEPYSCSLKSIIPVLNSPILTNSGPLLIATHINFGPEILLWTSHQVLAAPYHRNLEGLNINDAIFSNDLEQTRRTVEEYGVDLIYVCQNENQSNSSPAISQADFASRLQLGDAPEWLDEVFIQGARKGEHLYRFSHKD
jgi:hypothetical protein